MIINVIAIVIIIIISIKIIVIDIILMKFFIKKLLFGFSGPGLSGIWSSSRVKQKTHRRGFQTTSSGTMFRERISVQGRDIGGHHGSVPIERPVFAGNDLCTSHSHELMVCGNPKVELIAELRTSSSKRLHQDVGHNLVPLERSYSWKPKVTMQLFRLLQCHVHAPLIFTASVPRQTERRRG